MLRGTALDLLISGGASGIGDLGSDECGAIRLGPLSLVCALLATFVGAGASSAETAEPELVAPGKLTVGVDLTYPPYDYRAGGGPAGFDIDFDRALAGRMGLVPDFVDTSFGPWPSRWWTRPARNR